jgi:hypothetical protein
MAGRRYQQQKQAEFQNLGDLEIKGRKAGSLLNPRNERRSRSNP